MEKFRSRSIAIFERKLSFNRSERTIEVYSSCLLKLFQFYPCVKPSEITDEQFESFLYQKLTEGISDSYQNQFINAIKAYRELVLNKKPSKKFNRLRPRKKKHLPKPISEEQIIAGFKQIKNIKHRTYCLLMYGTGLRISEVLSLRLSNFNKGILTIRGKGDKDRVVTYSEVLKDLLYKYAIAYKITDHLFPGYSTTSIRNVVRKHFDCTPHQLRHSFATHSIDHGTNLRSLQVMLGHSSSRTTEVYTQVSVAHLKCVYKTENVLA